jgi:hypothetical protein
MTAPAVAAVESLGVQTTEAMHAGGQPLAGSLDEQMEMGSHQAPGMQLPVEAVRRLLEEKDERLSVVVVAVDEDLARPA